MCNRYDNKKYKFKRFRVPAGHGPGSSSYLSWLFDSKLKSTDSKTNERDTSLLFFGIIFHLKITFRKTFYIRYKHLMSRAGVVAVVAACNHFKSITVGTKKILSLKYSKDSATATHLLPYPEIKKSDCVASVAFFFVFFLINLLVTKKIEPPPSYLKKCRGG